VDLMAAAVAEWKLAGDTYMERKGVSGVLLVTCRWLVLLSTAPSWGDRRLHGRGPSRRRLLANDRANRADRHRHRGSAPARSPHRFTTSPVLVAPPIDAPTGRRSNLRIIVTPLSGQSACDWS